MIRRQVLLWLGLVVLFLSFGICPEGVAKESYKVKSGDNLYNISKKLGVRMQALKKANCLTNNLIKPDQTLTIPKIQPIAKCRTLPTLKAKSYTVRKGDSLFIISKKTGLSVKKIKKINHLRTAHLNIGQILALSKPEIETKVVATNVIINDTRQITATEDESEENGEGADGEDSGEEDNRTEVKNDEENNTGLLGKWSDFNEREVFVRVVKGFLGAPYRFGGSSVRGLDCSAFVKKIYNFFGVNLPRTAREQAQIGMRVSRNDLEKGDLIFFNARQVVSHVGIYIGDNKFIHASSKRKEVRVDNLESPYYDRHFVRAVRLKGMDGEV
ncbi:MAG: NlpC/P60 family protein [Syntrophales bacterium]